MAIQSFRSFNCNLRGFLTAGLAVGLSGAALLALGGCADMLTYSQDAKKQGAQEYNDGKYADAVGSFMNAARQDPTNADTEYRLGLSYEQNKNYHEAINAYKTCLRLIPAPGTAMYNPTLHDQSFERLARVVALTDSSNTETNLIVKTALDNNSSSDYQLLGRIFRYRGDADTAIEDYRQATKFDPDNFSASKELGLYLLKLGQNQDAAMVLRDAYRLNQDDKVLNDSLMRIGMVPGPDLLAQSRMKAPVPAAPSNLLPDPGALDAVPAGSTDGPAPTMAMPKD
jgi:tetratricopeptide (TPR) repeat protein